ncbi:4573_t:CDS:2 [Dentiscutata erythropus]|uniref:4573_t:CDS:1 n=1 Tax=Dentiscutata erythropus TaxID=1348616 RepID=A0A9N9DJ76_9GLOM|nr:4573_t:CDS:2 [Dentiscutata erythropus]
MYSGRLGYKTYRSDYIWRKKIVNLLKPFEEITRHFAPISKKGESLESWIDLIYGSEDPDTNDDLSLSSDNEANIPSAENRKQWQYTH